MADRAPSHESCCKTSTVTCPCPVCGNAGRTVGVLTLERHVPERLRTSIGDDATFCLNPECEAVYCNPRGFVVKRGETLVPVTIKDSGDDVRVCYCFDISRGNVRKDLTKRGESDIPDRIKKGIAEGRCDCETKNPQGACCLGNVAAEIKRISAEVKRNA